MSKHKIIAVTNNKGGVGKTTSTANLGACLAKRGNKVLLIDVDPQCNLSMHFKPEDGYRNTIEDFFSSMVTLQETVSQTRLEQLYIIPATYNLSSYALHDKEHLAEGIGGLKKDNYDYILIDTPPSLTELTPQALHASDSVIIPALPSYYSQLGIEGMYRNQVIFKDLEILGVFICQADQRRTVTQAMFESFKDYFPLFETTIPISEDIRQAELFRETIIEYKPKSKAALSYINLTEEICLKQPIALGIK